MEHSATAQFVLDFINLFINTSGVALILGAILILSQRKAIDATIRKLVKIKAGGVVGEFQKDSLLTDLADEGAIEVDTTVQTGDELTITYPRLTQTEIAVLDLWLVPATRFLLTALSGASGQHTPWQIDFQMSTVIADANERAAILGALLYAGLMYLDSSNLTIIVSNRGLQYIEHRQQLEG